MVRVVSSLFLEDKVAAVIDRFAVLGLDEEGGAAVLEELESIDVRILVGLDEQTHGVRSVGLPESGAFLDVSLENQAMDTAVGEVTGPSEVGQVGYDMPVLDLDGIVVDMSCAPSEGIHHPYLHFEVAGFDTFVNQLCSALQARSTVFAAFGKYATTLEEKGGRHK